MRIPIRSAVSFIRVARASSLRTNATQAGSLRYHSTAMHELILHNLWQARLAAKVLRNHCSVARSGSFVRRPIARVGCEQASVRAARLASRPRPRRNRTGFHHWFHREEECRQKKDRWSCAGFRLRGSTDGGCADAGFALARFLSASANTTRAQFALRVQVAGCKKTAAQIRAQSAPSPPDRAPPDRARLDPHPKNVAADRSRADTRRRSSSLWKSHL